MTEEKVKMKEREKTVFEKKVDVLKEMGWKVIFSKCKWTLFQSLSEMRRIYP